MLAVRMTRGNFFCLLLVLFCTLWECTLAQGTCSKVNSCKCSFGEGIVVDLSALKGSPKFPDQWDPSFVNQFSYNPCGGFTEGTCDNVAVCQFTGSDYFACGSQDSATFATDAVSGKLSVQYSSTDGSGFKRTSAIILNCVQDGTPDSLDVNGEDPVTLGLYNFQLNSVHCCPVRGGGGGGDSSSLSVGSIIVIGFFAILVSYFVAGIVIQKYARKASGKEVIPNSSLWMALPGPIKDGVLFIVRRGRTDYQKI